MGSSSSIYLFMIDRYIGQLLKAVSALLIVWRLRQYAQRNTNSFDSVLWDQATSMRIWFIRRAIKAIRFDAQIDWFRLCVLSTSPL